MRKILFLGGTALQIPAIQCAKEQGYYTILCDYQPNNPGKNYSDEYHCVSTTDKEAILEVARKREIDGIVAYISDTAAPTAAYVSNKLNLPSNPYESVLILTKKDLFRKFLKEHGFNCPRAESYKSIEEAMSNLGKFHFPLMVKPIDSSGSRGISRIDSIEEFENAFNNAILYSKEKIVIVEEFIEMSHDYQIGGDVFVLNGKLEFCGFLNCHRNNLVNPYIPIGKSFPIFLGEEKLDFIRKELQRLISLLNITMGAFNIEVVFGENGEPFFIEIGPRNGGNLIPDFLKIITGIDFIKATIESSLGNDVINLKSEYKEEFLSIYTLHSAEQGKLVDICFSNKIKDNIIKKVIYKEKGSNIDFFNGGDKTLGYVFFKFNSWEELKNKMDNMSNYITIELSN